MNVLATMLLERLAMLRVAPLEGAHKQSSETTTASLLNECIGAMPRCWQHYGCRSQEEWREKVSVSLQSELNSDCESFWFSVPECFWFFWKSMWARWVKFDWLTYWTVLFLLNVPRELKGVSSQFMSSMDMWTHRWNGLALSWSSQRSSGLRVAGLLCCKCPDDCWPLWRLFSLPKTRDDKKLKGNQSHIHSMRRFSKNSKSLCTRREKVSLNRTANNL